MLSLVMPRRRPKVHIDPNKPSDAKAAREREAYKIFVTWELCVPRSQITIPCLFQEEKGAPHSS